ncbi:MAG: class I SAM-dependent methyltransferase [Acidimicrobiaceae bacterium]|nr:class I SAM-dependent methyltransferase [Acidimicrobiaceae bacterium]
MAGSEQEAWDAYAEAYQARMQLSTSVVSYGPDIPTEADLRLLGDVKGKRVLDLGCGGGQAVVTFAKQGATAVGVDYSGAQLAWARRLAAAEEVRVDLRQNDLAELAFVRADSMDLVFSAYALQYVEDLGRVFRQVHRVLKVGAPLVFSIPHPSYQMLWGDPAGGVEVDGDPGDPPVIRRSYFERAPFHRQREADGESVTLTEYPRTLGDVYIGLVRASFRVDVLLEPSPAPGPRSQVFRPAMAWVPSTLIVRARKEGN